MKQKPWLDAFLEQMQKFGLGNEKHTNCAGWYDRDGEFDCGYSTILLCEECKYGGGRKNPKAKCNRA